MGSLGVGRVRAANPGGAVPAGPARALHVHESALDFEGGGVTNTVTVGGSANTGAALKLTCPDGLRIDTVTFASYGKPSNPCTPTTTVDCDGKNTTTTCNFGAFGVNGACNSATANPTAVVATACAGRASCEYVPTAAVWGTPCAGQLYLSVHATARVLPLHSFTGTFDVFQFDISDLRCGLSFE